MPGKSIGLLRKSNAIPGKSAVMLGKSIGVLGISTIWLENLLEYRRNPEDCQGNALEYQENLVASTEIY